MAIYSINSTSFPMVQAGLITAATEDVGYYVNAGVPNGTVVSLIKSNQVAGLVPVFLCSGDDCRYGLDGADSIADPRLFVLPVFAQTSGSTDPYYNDSNSFLFDFPNYAKPNCSMTFYLDRWVNNAWQAITLNNNTFGTLYKVGDLCKDNTWTGFVINWAKVLTTYSNGGTFRFRMVTSQYAVASLAGCFVSPMFCLTPFDCHQADRTVKFETTMSGGILGNIDKANCGGAFWSFCCQGVVNSPSTTQGSITTYITTPITWSDSIRFGGKFGDEQSDTERKKIKYATGVVNKIRDEALLNYMLHTTALPGWFHRRFNVYGLFADQLLVSDYNIYHTDYGFKRFCVQADAGYQPKPNRNSQYQEVDIKFVPATQYLVRQRCCDPNPNIPQVFPT